MVLAVAAGLVLLPSLETAAAAAGPATAPATTAAAPVGQAASAAPGETSAKLAGGTIPGQPDLSGAFVPSGPTRLLDTRDGTGTGGDVRPVGQNPLLLDISQVSGNSSVRPTAVVLNVTVTNPTGDSYLAVYPVNGVRPTTSNLNFSPGQTVANQVTVQVGSNGQVSFFNHVGTTDVIADLAGYFTLDKAASTFVANGPTRLLDTRDGIGTGGVRAQVGENASIGLQIAGVAGVPARNVTAVVLNVTVTEPTAESFVTVYPSGSGVPSASNLNFSAGQTVPNLVTVPVGADGKVAFYNHVGSTDVVADLAGYYVSGEPRTGGVFRNRGRPTRLLDTREGIGTGGVRAQVGENASIGLQVAGVSEIPARSVTAVVLNVTVTAPTAESFLTVYPSGSGVPSASSLNFSAGQTVPNLVTVPVGPDGKVAFYNHAGSTDVVADIFGYFSVGDQLGLSALSFSSPTVDASTGTAAVTLTWTVTDSNPESRYNGGTIVIRQQGDAPDTYVGQSRVVSFTQENNVYGGAAFVSGNVASATYSYRFAVPRYAGAATAKWAVSLVMIYDESQQRQVLAGSALGGFGNILTATSQVSTVTALKPSLLLNLNGSMPYVYYAADSSSVAYSIGIQEQQSGFWNGTLQLSGPGGATLSGSFELSASDGLLNYPCQGDARQPSCTAIVQFPSTAPAGVWSVSTVTLTNNAGQSRSFTNLNMLPVTFTLNGTLRADGFTTTPTELITWVDRAPFKLSMNVTGAQNGVRSIETRWNGMCTQGSTYPVGEPDGRLSVSVVLGHSMGSSWSACVLTGVAITDGAGNLALYGSNFRAPDPGVSVRSIPDTTPPTAISAALTVTSVPCTTNFISVGLRVRVSDPTNAVQTIRAFVYDGTGKSVHVGTGAMDVFPEGEAVYFISFPNGPLAVGAYTVGFSISDAGGLTTFYGTPGGQPVPGGPLTLEITAG
ncbi:hypothetical protein [Kitasatospora purpeofusca]|uniref:hypothetical protein n=1 Tax=Kitasatospora purpeofusca TaxID=67352 RepID=UPI002A59D95E|nr:hypothetical protein [Kitasatospora purpeofusca]MDY0816623.1 hypothetical protein [Kitasatospora purpeofusca]